ncbi:MAG: transglycosylase SLT domain-containing protein [Myxococcota bacterium]
MSATSRGGRAAAGGSDQWALCTALSALVLLGPLTPWAGSKSPVDTLRSAREHWEGGDLDEALERLAKLEAGELRDHIALIRATWLMAEDRLDEALEAARMGMDHDPPAELRARTWQRIAEIELARGDLLAAYRAQRRAWETTDSQEYAAELTVELAEAFERADRPGAALNLYRRAWQGWPLAEGSEQAYRRSRQLEAATGADAPNPEALLERADRMRGAFHCDAALPSYEELSRREDLAPEQRRQVAGGRAECLFQLRRYPDAAVAYRHLHESDASDFDAAIRNARAEARSGRRKQAISELRRVVRKAPAKEQARARYLLAILLGDDSPGEARKLLRAVERQRARRGLARRARWQLAWAELGDGRPEAARKRLQPLARGSQWDIEVQRARYWRAVARLASDPNGGRKELAALAESLPLSYYGLLAAQRLGQAPDLHRSFVGERAPSAGRPHGQRASWLIDSGFDDNARDELRSWLSDSLTREERLEAARLLHRLGDHFRAVRVLIDGFGGALEQGIDPDWREAWQMAWPRPFDSWVRRAVEEFGFDPALVYAVMREESTYRPGAESPAGAIGLMQIIPPTAGRIARTLKVPVFEPSSLFDPATNIRFGTYYLKSLKERFRGSAPLAIAAYNAGPEAVDGWIARDGVQPSDAFVESVPYGETRRYLRRVLRSYQVYRLLYGDAQSQAVLVR